MSAQIIPLFPKQAKPTEFPQLSLSKRQKDYLTFLLIAPKDYEGWIRLSQQDVYSMIGMRPETQKKYRELFVQMGIIEVVLPPAPYIPLIRFKTGGDEVEKSSI